jgi:hypothetical protein
MHRLSSNTACRVSCWAPLSRQVQQAPAQSVSRPVVKRAVAFKSAIRKTILHTDITALITTKSDDKEWQTVSKKAVRSWKQPILIQIYKKRVQRLIFWQKSELENSTAEQTDLVLVLNQVLIKKDLLSFLWIADTDYIINNVEKFSFSASG